MGDQSAMHCDAHGFYRCGICETLEDSNIRLERRIAELEFKVKLGDQFKERAHYVAAATQAAWEETVGELKEENQRLRDTIIYAKGRMKAYGIVDARIDLPGGWNEK